MDLGRTTKNAAQRYGRPEGQSATGAAETLRATRAICPAIACSRSAFDQGLVRIIMTTSRRPVILQLLRACIWSARECAGAVQFNAWPTFQVRFATSQVPSSGDQLLRPRVPTFE